MSQERGQIIQLAMKMVSLMKEKEAAVAERDFDRAMRLRDQQEQCRDQLQGLNLPEVARINVRRLTESVSGKFPVLDMLQSEPGDPDSRVLGLLPSPLVPPLRIALAVIPSCPVTTLAAAMAPEDIFSPYFRPMLPVFSPDTVGRIREPTRLDAIQAAFHEIRRCGTYGYPVVLSILRPTELQHAGLLEAIAAGLNETASEFVVFEEASLLPSILDKIPSGYRLIED